MSIYQQFGLTPIINASGAVTRLGGAPMPQAVLDAFAAAATETVSLEELQGAASRRIAEATATDGEILYGVFPEWTTNGTGMGGAGEFLEYGIAENTQSMSVMVQYGAFEREATVVAQPGTVEVRNSNDITTCSHASPGALWLAAPGLLLLGLRRRRTA